MAKAAPTATKPVRVNPPAPPVAAKAAAPKQAPAQAKAPAKPQQKPTEQTAQTRTPEKLLPPEPIKPRPAHQPTRHRSNSLFGPGGPFGFLR